MPRIIRFSESYPFKPEGGLSISRSIGDWQFKDEGFASAVSNEAQIKEIDFNNTENANPNTIEFILLGCDGVWKGARASEEYERAKKLAELGILLDAPLPKDKIGHTLMKFVAESISIFDQQMTYSGGDPRTITASTIQNLLSHLVQDRGHFGQGIEYNLGQRENEEWSKFLRSPQNDSGLDNLSCILLLKGQN